MSSKLVLVLGSKPGAVIPKLDFQSVYTANGAISLVDQSSFLLSIRDRGLRVHSVLSSGQLNKSHIESAIISAQPDRVLARRNKVDVKALLNQKLPASELVNWSTKQQWAFQWTVFGMTLFLGELYYETNWPKIIQRFYDVLRGKERFGLSTGSFAALLALIENPDSNVVLSGIGLSKGGHFNDDSLFREGRARVDLFLMPRLPKNLKERLSTTDEYFAKVVGVRLIK